MIENINKNNTFNHIMAINVNQSIKKIIQIYLGKITVVLFFYFCTL